MDSKRYDYIFLGAGCASISILMRMIHSKKFFEKKILIIDKEPKTKNDRTWCFWEEEPGFFEDIVYRKWKQVFFKTTGADSIPLEMGNYQYKMIQGIDFYKKCFSELTHQKNIDIVYGDISFGQTNELITIKINDEPLVYNKNTIIFNSLYIPSEKQKNKFYLLQHFKGWIIESKENVFDPAQATLMDFRVRQNHGTTFVYVLPLSSTKALLEYTLFSENILPDKEYDNELQKYLEEFLNLHDYTVVEEEFGVIPMTNKNFPYYKDGMYFIGTAGGQTKASTGYTFRFIQKQAEEIVGELIVKGNLSKKKKLKRRFYFYDSTLLHILSKKLLAGKLIFSILFKKNKAADIFKFLDNETTLNEELKLLNSLPKKVFIKAGFSEFIKMIVKN
ncbi:lycopene cyclase [Ginsengibacter hankyongi]|uniref:Lycopene cyclase n=1 Tax=Ginsengibacter hankyongi TaxID=2607284 RepID=A0A5J5IP60_9BACT|nr:lycopene cyclase family protein [Ginsengibacter hankyongi]KAA9041807.1 lycopene cyclase [Ginsengibacter hankyongi]